MLTLCLTEKVILSWTKLKVVNLIHYRQGVTGNNYSYVEDARLVIKLII